MIVLRLALAIVPLFAFLTAAAAEDAKGSWVAISEEVTSQVKPGYPGKTAGVTVDPATGDVFMVVPDQGIWKSTNQGESFSRIDEENIGGRCETGYALNFDPAGKRLACFMIYGSSASTTDGGKTWNRWKTSHLDFGAVDWEKTGKALLGFRHENHAIITLSEDGGETWTDLGEGFVRLGMFDSNTLVCGKREGLLRSTDGGKTWSEVSEVTPRGFVMVVREGIGYWPTEKGLLVSRDRGESWKIEGAERAIAHGPMFGRESGHMVVVGREGFLETTDGGENWKQVAPLPEGFTVGGVGPNYAWDSVNNIFYASSMGKPTYRFRR
mgnify:CR=1 FL=1